MFVLKLLMAFAGFSGIFICANGQELIECNNITKFMKEYTKMLDMIPREIIPVSKFCSNSTFVQHYSDATKTFQMATHDKSCHLHRNRLDILQMIFDQMNSIWGVARCQDCLDNQNDTENFFRLSDQLYDCISNSPLNPCEACASNYSLVQGHYEGISKSRKQQICFDIEDQMNQTRHAWSAKYNCCKDKQYSQKVFIMFASAISCLPVMFYAALYMFTLRKEAREEIARVPLLDEPEPEANTTGDAALQSSSHDDLIIGEADDEPLASASSAFVPKYAAIQDNDETKLNNLDLKQVRESRLIDLASEVDDADSSYEYNLDAKPPTTLLDDDVSILGVPSESKVNNFLDSF
ncbi:uncharacterized protein LOC131681185 [Topomyia yanbarensis]|uniref:uncharacterized protein LOC131681185 n=1 Tax=Topomyia yanbarensis TaxID=2498891 RepID=UPI00273B7379|nr:uncharacterized protein LOC131681185 [Topomyia yanbarensis]